MSVKTKLLQLLDRKAIPNEIKNDPILKTSNIKKIIEKMLNKTESLSNRKSSPNFLRYGIKQEIFNVRSRNERCYIRYNNKKIYIRNQDYFSHLLVDTIIDSSKSNPLFHKIFNKNIYEYNDFYSMDMFLGQIEVPRNNYRTDLEFKYTINDKDYCHIIEYFEIKGHSKFYNRQEDNFRLYNIIKNNNNIIGATYFLEEKWDFKKDDYFETFVSKLTKILYDNYYLMNKRKYVINELNKITNQRELSKMLYDSHVNKNDFVINKNLIDHIITWKNSKMKKNIGNFLMKIYQ